MEIIMKQREFDLLDDEKLIWACVEPIILKIRGKDLKMKSQVYMQLNSGQRALLLFQVLYGHANHGISQFFSQISYLMDQLDIWSALKSGMKYFGDVEMLGLVEKMEDAYYAGMEQNENAIPLDELDRLYHEKVSATLKRIGSSIRNHPAEFIRFED